MKFFSLNLLSCVFVILLLASPSSASEDQWNASIDAILTELVESEEALERAETIFKSHDRSKISVRAIENGKEQLYKEIYYSRGELFVNDHSKDWNIITKGDYVYAWKNGQSDGYKYKKNIDDILMYIGYSLDPSFILSSLYRRHISDPEASTTSTDPETSITTAYFKEPRYGMLAIMYGEKPFWFHGWISQGQMSGRVRKVFFEMPEHYDQVPGELFDKMRDIKFEERNYGLRELLTYV